MKRKLKKYFARAIPLFSALCVLVSVFAFSASAVTEVLDYNDYIYDIQADGENDIVYVRIPVDKFSWISWNEYDISSGSSTSRSDDDPGNSISITFRPGYYYAIRLYPLYLAHLGLDNIPEGTVFDMSFRWDWDLPTDETYIMDMNPRIVPSIQYYDSSGKKLWSFRDSDYGDDFGVPGEDLHLYLTYKQSSLVSTVPSSCDPRFQLTYYFYDGAFSESVTANIQITSFTIQMSISSLYREQQQNDKSNALMDEISDQLAEQGKTMEDVLDQQTQTNDKLDDIINGDVEPETPVGADKVDDLDSAESELRDQAQAGLDESLKVQQSALDILLEYAGAFAVFSWLFGLFADIPFLKGLLYVSMSIGLLASVLSIANSVSSFSARHAPKEPSIKYHYHWHSGYRNKDNGG